MKATSIPYVNLLLLFPVLLVIGLFGCSQPEDPLEWKISAEDSRELRAWMKHYLPLMPEELSIEVNHAINNVWVSKRRGSGSNEPTVDYVARQFDELTVREILIRGAEISNEVLRARLSNELESLRRLSSYPETAEHGTNNEIQITARRTVIEQLKQQIEMSDARLVALKTPARN